MRSVRSVRKNRHSRLQNRQIHNFMAQIRACVFRRRPHTAALPDRPSARAAYHPHVFRLLHRSFMEIQRFIRAADREEVRKTAEIGAVFRPQYAVCYTA